MPLKVTDKLFVRRREKKPRATRWTLTGEAILASFTLNTIPTDRSRLFYECDECGLAGISSFERSEMAVPEDVVNQILTHVHLNHEDD